FISRSLFKSYLSSKSIPLIITKQGVTLEVYFVSATCCEIQKPTQSYMRTYKYFGLLGTLKYNSSARHASETLGVIFSKYAFIGWPEIVQSIGPISTTIAPFVLYFQSLLGHQ